MNYDELTKKFEDALEKASVADIIGFFEDRGYEFEEIYNKKYYEGKFDNFFHGNSKNQLFSNDNVKTNNYSLAA